jgi:hypothetical protein
MGTQIPNMASYQAMVANPTQQVEFSKSSVTVVAGREYTLWRAAGFPSPGLGFYGTTPVTCTSATVGALPFINSTNTQRIVACFLHMASVGAIGMVHLHDRYIHNSGYSGTATGSIAVNTPALPARAGSAIGVRAAAEIWVTIGSVATTISLSSYTDAINGGGRVGPGVTIGSTGWRDPPRWIPFTLAPGDRGVSSVENYTLTASTTTVGDFGIVLYRTLLSVPIHAVPQRNLEEEGILGMALNMPIVPNDACLFQTLVLNTTSTGVFMGYYSVAEMP